MQAGAAGAAGAAGVAAAAGAAGVAGAAAVAGGRFSKVPGGESQKSIPAAMVSKLVTAKMAAVDFFITFSSGSNCYLDGFPK